MEKEAPKDSPWKKVSPDPVNTTAVTQNWPSLSDAKVDSANASGGETATTSEPKKESVKAVKNEKTESENDKPPPQQPTKKRGQIKKKQLDIELGGRKQASNKRESRPRNGRKKDDNDKEEKVEDKKSEKMAPPAQASTQVQGQAPASSNNAQSQPSQQSKPKKTSRGNGRRGSNGRNKQNNQQAQSSYPVDVTQQPWYPPYQQSVVDPAQVQMEPNHIILDDEALKKALVLQIEYYFSDANLQKGQSQKII